ncbi:cation transporter [Paenibacillus yanchengensis]|uniref:Cation transporter n=1 Tax=Paenibacillus yanchengensis TaxID=2035833 RepID=A0ABW4YJ24_9BACL
MSQAVLNVEGMSCNHCVNAVEGAVAEAGASGKVDLATKQVTIDYNIDQVTVEAIIAAIEEQGYDVIK